jgi:hypothetical protein
MAAVVGLTFLFGFGNVLNRALRLGVPGWVAPLVAPAVDLSVVGLLLGIRHLAVHSATPEQLHPARRLLIFSSLVALALNVADPIITGQFGKAAFDAVGPLLLIGWVEVGPGLLGALATTVSSPTNDSGQQGQVEAATAGHSGTELSVVEPISDRTRSTSSGLDEGLLNRARQEDRHHWLAHRRPISSDALRKKLHIGANKARELVTVVRSEYQPAGPLFENTAREPTPKSPARQEVEDDMTTVSLGRQFAVVFVAFNSIFYCRNAGEAGRAVPQRGTASAAPTSRWTSWPSWLGWNAKTVGANGKARRSARSPSCTCQSTASPDPSVCQGSPDGVTLAAHWSASAVAHLLATRAAAVVSGCAGRCWCEVVSLFVVLRGDHGVVEAVSGGGEVADLGVDAVSFGGHAGEHVFGEDSGVHAREQASDGCGVLIGLRPWPS